MHRYFRVGVPVIALLMAFAAPHGAAAQEEFPPPAGKGRVVVVASGGSGPREYRDISKKIAALGYDAVLFDSSRWSATDTGLRAAITTALQMPHALPGKVGLVGLSLGGGFVLGFGTALSDEVAVVAAWYPATFAFNNLPKWASRLSVPTVMFAGEYDTYQQCCLIDKARAIGKAAQAAGAPFELTIYPAAPHGFALAGENYRAEASADAFAKTEAALKKALK